MFLCIGELGKSFLLKSERKGRRGKKKMREKKKEAKMKENVD